MDGSCARWTAAACWTAAARAPGTATADTGARLTTTVISSHRVFLRPIMLASTVTAPGYIAVATLISLGRSSRLSPRMGRIFTA
jgi:hypothetical protein